MGQWILESVVMFAGAFVLSMAIRILSGPDAYLHDGRTRRMSLRDVLFFACFAGAYAAVNIGRIDRELDDARARIVALEAAIATTPAASEGE